MKFSLVEDYTYFWPVTVDRPDPENAGRWVAEDFEMEFTAMSQDQAEALDLELLNLPADQRAARQHDHLLKVARGWRGVVDNDGEEVTFSRERLEKMLKAAAWYRLAIYKAYQASLHKDEARKGN